MSEDCLFVDVYLPSANALSPGSSLPVMLFIHGTKRRTCLL